LGERKKAVQSGKTAVEKIIVRMIDIVLKSREMGGDRVEYP